MSDWLWHNIRTAFDAGDKVQVSDDWFGHPWYIGQEGVVENVYLDPREGAQDFLVAVEFPGDSHTPWPVKVQVPERYLKPAWPDAPPEWL